MRALLFLTLLAWAAVGTAQTMYKCTDARQRVTYSNESCEKLGLKDAGPVAERTTTMPLAPPGLPPAITQRLARELNAVLAGTEVRAQHDRLGFAIRSSSPAELGQVVKEQLEVWRRAIRDAKIPVE